MLQLKNQTPFAADFAAFPNHHGIDSLYTLVKATFNIGSNWTLSDVQLPIQHADQYVGEPGESSVIIPSDIHTGKACTDILMIGNAMSLGGNQVYRMSTSLQVGGIQKQILVTGDREWNDGRITSPMPFSQMPLCFERAFGGTAVDAGKIISADNRNPIGVGFFDRKIKRNIQGQPLPNLEYIGDEIITASDLIAPACYGPVSPNWEPRSNYCGTYDDEWTSTRAPYLPKDYDVKFMNSAPADQQYNGFLVGGEQVTIKGMHPNGDINFALPEIKLRCRVRKNGQDFTPPFFLETLILNPNQLQLSMVWRSSLECDKHMLKIDEIAISLAR